MSLRSRSLAHRSLPSTAIVRGKGKGQHTRALILDAALSLATRQGLQGLTLGVLADQIGMSKSGVFAHFGSREELQASVIREYQQRFDDEVFQPVLRYERGLLRLRALFDRWLNRVALEIDSGGLYIVGALEFDDQPGLIRDALLGLVNTWQGVLKRALQQTVDAGHFVTGTPVDQILFEVHSIVLGAHHEARFLGKKEILIKAQTAFTRIMTLSLSATGQSLMLRDLD